MVLDENQKIGVGLIVLGCAFIILGVLLFFDTALLAIGNALFLVGIVFSIGVQRSLAIFTRSDRIRGSILFFGGIVLVLLRWGLIGLIVEAFGFINLFGNFLPAVLSVARQVPYLSSILDFPVVSHAVDFLARKTRPKYSV